MRAVWYERKGPAEEVLTVGTMPDPAPGPGEVRVAIALSAVNPSDTKARGGWGGNIAMPFPRVIPHQDGAGTIDRVGEGVASDRIGERVWVYMAQRGRPFGTAAQYCVVPSARAIALPPEADFAAGAAMGIPAMTAHRCIFSDGPVDGATVLVRGGAGAVGYYAIQWAKRGGAKRVIATVSREEQAGRAREAGADIVLDYKRDSVVDAIVARCGAAAVDRIVEVDLGTNADADAVLLARNGVIAAYASDRNPAPAVPFLPLLMKDATIRFVLVYEMPEVAKAAAIRDITSALAVNALRHQVAATLPFASIAQAHAAVEAGRSVGKILVAVDDT
ncbi:MAG: NADPH:quinone reductase [Casimicrobiaceae bacterium]